MKMIKKIKFLCIIAVAIASVSCGKEDIAQAEEKYSGRTVELHINFSGLSTTTTRSFFDDVGNFANRESKISNVRLFLYDSEGSYVQTYDIYSNNVNGTYSTIRVPVEICGKNCVLFAIANCVSEQSATTTLSEMYLYSTMGDSTSDYNGTVESHLNNDSTHSFMMSGHSSFYVQPYGLKTVVTIELTRLLSKVAFRYKIDENFQVNHNGGMIRIDRTALTRFATDCYIFRQNNRYHPSPTTCANFDQEPLYMDGYYHHIFYFLELGETGNGDYRTGITMWGTWDNDGDFSTEDDQTSFQLDIPINPDNTGIVKRNTYYKIDGIVKGIGSANLDLTFSLTDWVEVEQNITI
jgi:hypothetical protein